MQRTKHCARIDALDYPAISFDESGNTGQNLLDLDQPVFVLASVGLDDYHCREIIGSTTDELHFSDARKSRKGRERILKVIESLDTRDIKVAVINKSFMTTGKMVDELLEPMMYEVGIDGYESGELPALANLWHFTFDPTFGADVLPRLQDRFVSATRLRNPIAGEEFYRIVDALVSRTDGVDMPGLKLLAQTRPQMQNLINDWELPPLEPGIPAVNILVHEWSQVYPDGFMVRHDFRGDATEWLSFFKPFFDQEKEPEVFGFPNGVEIRLPLPVSDFELRASHDHPAIQIADIVAGATASIFRARVRNLPIDKFVGELDETQIKTFVVGMVWPDRNWQSEMPVPGRPFQMDSITKWLSRRSDT